MSDSKAGLRRKIESAADLHSVVRTMKALAASSIEQYEKSVRALADYYRTVELGLGASFRQLEAAGMLATWPVPKDSAVACAIVFGSDQGLVGEFNDVIADHTVETLARGRRTAQIWTVGARVQGRLSDAGHGTQVQFTVPSSVKGITSLVGQILQQIVTLRRREQTVELYLFYNRPAAGAVYSPFSQRLLPLDASWCREQMNVPWPTRNPPEVLGGTAETLEALIGEHIFISLFRASAESLASENASRLAAMQRAEKSIDGLLGDLRVAFNRLRQSSIDEELFDVISGFEALSRPAH